jgi:hypothetical protein
MGLLAFWLSGTSVVPEARVIPAASVWYRGTPAGRPRQDDLATIRALGFTAVTWPAPSPRAVDELRRMAALVSLDVHIRRPEPPLTAARASEPGPIVDVRVRDLPAWQLSAVVWRAVAHGARTVAFDAGEPAGAGVLTSRGQTAAWVGPARTLARHLAANGPLFDRLGVGRALPVESTVSKDLDLQLFELSRDWVIIATNLARVRVEASARLPPDVPYAPWGDLLDGSAPPMAMRDEVGGARWPLSLEGGAARIYVTTKRPGATSR